MATASEPADESNEDRAARDQIKPFGTIDVESLESLSGTDFYSAADGYQPTRNIGVVDDINQGVTRVVEYGQGGWRRVAIADSVEGAEDIQRALIDMGYNDVEVFYDFAEEKAGVYVMPSQDQSDDA